MVWVHVKGKERVHRALPLVISIQRRPPAAHVVANSRFPESARKQSAPGFPVTKVCLRKTGLLPFAFGAPGRARLPIFKYLGIGPSETLKRQGRPRVKALVEVVSFVGQ